jgi:nucleoside-diphosphate-sugar epimerase
MRIVVLGSAGLVGRALTERLVTDGHDVVGVDLVDGPRVDHRLDVLRDDLSPALNGADAVAHLVARVDPPHPLKRREMRRLHVDGTRRIVAAVRGAGIGRFVLASSAVVYGAWPDAVSPLTEDSPVRPLPDFPYAVDKAEQERIVDAAGLCSASARLAIVYGRDARSFLTEFVRRAPGFVPTVDGRRPPLQVLHASDAAAALSLLLASDVTGPFNVASAGVTSIDGIARAAGARVVNVRSGVVAPLMRAGQWVAPRWARAPTWVLEHLRWPWVMSCRRIERELGYRAGYSAEAAVAEMVRG